MRNNHGEGRTQSAPRSEAQEVVGKYLRVQPAAVLGSDERITAGTTAQCHNCHTRATPFWRTDDEGKTLRRA